MANVDDIHFFEKGFASALRRIEDSQISEHNKGLIKNFVISCKRDGISKSTRTIYLNSLHRIAVQINKNLDEMTESDYGQLLLGLESRGYKEGYIYQYKKAIKKLYKWRYEDNPPKWAAQIKLRGTESPVQPSDLITREEIEKLYKACNHPKEKALIALLLDSGMRIGALGSLRIKNIEFNQYGAVLFLNKNSNSNKSTPAKGIPITWSTGYLNQWLAMHPDRNPEAPLWVNLKGRDRGKAMSYNAIRKALKNVAERAGVKKRIHPHLFRHTAITGWILERFTEQEIKHRAGWTKSSRRMLEVYGNFTDQEINQSIYARYGLSAEEKSVRLERCPRCHMVLAPEARVCHQCALVLDSALLNEMQKDTDKARSVLLKLLGNEDTKALIEELIKDQGKHE